MKKFLFLTLLLFFGSTISLFAGEADIVLPDFSKVTFPLLGEIRGDQLLHWGSLLIFFNCCVAILFFFKVKNEPCHIAMTTEASKIYKSCIAYLKSLLPLLKRLALFMFGVITYHIYLGNTDESFLDILSKMLPVMFWSLIGLISVYFMSWFGMRINTYANARSAYASFKKQHWYSLRIGQRAGMATGLILISIELFLMTAIIQYTDPESAGLSLVGFAIAESMGALTLRMAGGMFTKIADLGADKMKVYYNLQEDDPRNPGVIADCVGDNAGDSGGPTADGFETYGVTGVAVIIACLYILPKESAEFIIWLYFMRYFNDFAAAIAYFVNDFISYIKYRNKEEINPEEPQSRLIHITTIISLILVYGWSYLLIGHNPNNVWLPYASLIAIGIFSSALIPEITKKFTSGLSKYIKEMIIATRSGSALNILSGEVTGYFSAFWIGLAQIGGSMYVSYLICQAPGLSDIPHIEILGLGLLAYGLLCLGPVTIAVDSSGPVFDNAQSIFALSRMKRFINELTEKLGYVPDFDRANRYLELNDQSGNTFKATSKPVLIGTAAISGTVMIFSVSCLLESYGLLNVDLMDSPLFFIGLVLGPGPIFWFAGAAIKAVTTGAHRAIKKIVKIIKLDEETDYADAESSKSVVKICADLSIVAAKKINLIIICLTVGFAFTDPNLFIGYLTNLALTALYVSIKMANAGSAYDNTKKEIEVNFPHEKNTPFHHAAVEGDMVGDPYKDTASVAMNPLVKYSTLLGLLSIEIAVKLIKPVNGVYAYGTTHHLVAIFFLSIGFWKIFDYFRSMSITNDEEEMEEKLALTSIPSRVYADK